jgi:hypothetical protein
MKAIREALNTIKKIRGLNTDADLAADMGISLHTMRSWVRNESITRQLIQYCADRSISLDEALLGRRSFDKDRCGLCAMRLQCDEYRRATSAAMVVNEDMFSPKTIVLNTHLAERVAWSMFRQDVLKAQSSFDLENIDRIVVELQHSHLG